MSQGEKVASFVVILSLSQKMNLRGRETWVSSDMKRDYEIDFSVVATVFFYNLIIIMTFIHSPKL